MKGSLQNETFNNEYTDRIGDGAGNLEQQWQR
jgi:hypothetical protein